MKTYWLTIVATGAILAMSGSVAMAQDSRQQGGQNRPGNTQFDDHAQQVARDWNSQHQKTPPEGGLRRVISRAYGRGGSVSGAENKMRWILIVSLAMALATRGLAATDA